MVEESQTYGLTGGSKALNRTWEYNVCRWGSAPCGCPQKLEATDIILTSLFVQGRSGFLFKSFVFGRNRKWKFCIDINLQYKLY